MRMRSQVAALQLVAKVTGTGCVQTIFETSINNVAGEIMAVPMFNQLVDLFYSEQFCFYR